MLNIPYCIFDYICSNFLDFKSRLNFKNTCKYINKHVTKHIFYNNIFKYNGNTRFVINDNVRFLKLDKEFNTDISHIVNGFPNLVGLHLGSLFNQDISYLATAFPNLKFLHLGEKFNRNISYFSNSFKKLERLCLSKEFNGDISYFAKSFPNLKYLHLGYKYNKPLDDLKFSFPKLEELYLGHDFSNDISVITKYFKNLKVIQLSDKLIGDTKVLSPLPKLEKIYIPWNNKGISKYVSKEYLNSIFPKIKIFHYTHKWT